jgi:multidrug resistance protein, MATE family
MSTDAGVGAAEARQLPAQRFDAHGTRRIDLKAILTLAAPLMVTNAIQAVLNLTDTWFVGRLSTDAVAAMGSIYWLMTFFILVISGVGLAVQTFVSQAAGSRRRARASQATWSALWATLVSAPLFVGVAALGPSLLAPFRLPAEVESLAIAYWEPRMWGAVLGSMVWVLMGFFNGIGATRVTLLVAGCTTLANVPANEWLMFEAQLGMAGAAWGTNVAQLTGLLLAFTLMLSRRYAVPYRTRLTWRPNGPLVLRMLKVGAPVGVMYGADVLGVALFQLMIARVGSADAAATQIVMMLTSLAYLPTLGLATAGTTLVGQCIGAGDRDWAARVGTAVIFMCSALMLCIAGAFLVAGPWLMPMFLASADAAAAATLAVAAIVIWPAAVYQAFDGLYFGSSFCLRAAGDTRVPAITALLASWCLFIPLAHVLIFAPGQGWVDGLPQFGLGALGGWLALMVYAMLLGISMFLRWRSGRWRELRI